MCVWIDSKDFDHKLWVMCWTINSELFKMCSFKMGIKGERLISSLVLSHTQMSQCPVKILLQPPILLEGCVVKFQFLLFVFTCIAYKVLSCADEHLPPICSFLTFGLTIHVLKVLIPLSLTLSFYRDQTFWDTLHGKCYLSRN